jgi:hypothetical protein
MHKSHKDLAQPYQPRSQAEGSVRLSHSRRAPHAPHSLNADHGR